MSKKTKERKLSKAELKRKEEFEQLTEKLVAEGYRPNHITIGVVEANLLALVTGLPFIIPLVVAFFAVGHSYEMEYWTMLAAAAIFIVLTVVHELIHGITWAHYAETGWKSISFGIIMEYLTPYCSCNQPLKKKQIIIGSLMPTIILGIIPGIVAVICGSELLLVVAIIMIFGGGGDLLVTYKLLRFKSEAKDVLFIDHPYELGTAVFVR